MIDRLAELVVRFLPCAGRLPRFARGGIANTLTLLGFDQAPCFAMYSS